MSGVPVMGAIPTLKWIAGSAVRDPHWLTVSDNAWPGQEISPLLRLYDAFTGRPVPILDERIGEEIPWIPLGTQKVVEWSEKAIPEVVEYSTSRLLCRHALLRFSR